MRNFFKKFCLLSPVLILSMLLSCSSTKKVKYFQDIPDSGQLKTIPKAEYIEPTIQVDDILTIIIQTVDPTSAAVINLGNTPTLPTPNPSSSALTSIPQTATIGYLVNNNGEVEIPILGKIKLTGYTTTQARDVITRIASKYYKEPSVIVRFANFKISVTGEVLKPGQYIMPNEKVSVIDAIAMAGDLTIFGKRENVLLIRENTDGTKTPVRLNLKNSDIMSSPYYYLRQNDIIYVEPRLAKSDATDASRAKYITLAGALLSIILVLTTRRL